MSKITTTFMRGNINESVHEAKCLILDSSKKIIFSTKNDNDIIFPRSSIKIFQAIPFSESGAIKKLKLNQKQIALSCSSHNGEKFHIKELKKWVQKLNISENALQCGIHSPLDINSSNNLFLSRNKLTQLHNNCAGKHLAMISTAMIRGYDINSYLNINHPIQTEIRKSIELFSETKININNFAIDGCSAPQYGLKIKDIANALMNLSLNFQNKFLKSIITKKLINPILKNPKYIGGTYNLDSNIIKISDNQIFCKGGAEGVLLFVHLKKKIAGVLKVKDGNQRAIPSIVLELFKKLNILPERKNLLLKKIHKNTLENHAGKKIGKVITVIN